MFNKFAERLAEEIKAAGISYVKLSKAIGVSDTTIGYWVRGLQVPSAENVYLVAKYFSVTSDYLLGLTD